MSTLTRAAAAVAATLALAACSEPPAYTPEELEQAVEELREHYRQRDFVAGAELALEWSERAAGVPEVAAWSAANLSALGEYWTALEIAERAADSAPDDPWAHYSVAISLHEEERSDEAVERITAAAEALPENVDVAVAQLSIVNRWLGSGSALAQAERMPEAILRDPGFLAVLAGVRHGHQFQFRSDPEAAQLQRDSAVAILERALELAPSDPSVLHRAATTYFRMQRLEEASALYERALAVSPYDRTSHSGYWATINRRTDLTAEEKQRLIEESAERLLAARGHSLHTLRTVADGYGSIDQPDRQRELEDRVLAMAPASVSAEWVLIGRLRRDARQMYGTERETGERDPEQESELLEGMLAYLARPEHVNTALLGETYQDLFLLIKDDEDADPETLYLAVRGMVDYQTLNFHIVYPMGALALAERTTRFREAEEIARLGLDAARREADELRDAGYFKTEGDYERTLNLYLAMMRDALGWVYFQEGRLDDAETELMTATDLAQDKLVEPLYHLGRLHEARFGLAAAEQGIDAVELGDEALREHLERAEGFYARSVNVQRPGSSRPDSALRRLYVRLHDTDEGFEDYVASIADRDRIKRRDAILSARITDPRSAPPFDLAFLEGSRLELSEFHGKVVAINFWGMWCGPCVIEMPEFQDFYEAYRDDPEIVVLTIDTADDPDELREWMAEQGYDFPVLLDDGYVSDSNVTSFPTTWFIDREGRIAFIKSGWSGSLAEEFGWRVEALRGGGSP